MVTLAVTNVFVRNSRLFVTLTKVKQLGCWWRAGVGLTQRSTAERNHRHVYEERCCFSSQTSHFPLIRTFIVANIWPYKGSQKRTCSGNTFNPLTRTTFESTLSNTIDHRRTCWSSVKDIVYFCCIWKRFKRGKRQSAFLFYEKNISHLQLWLFMWVAGWLTVAWSKTLPATHPSKYWYSMGPKITTKSQLVVVDRSEQPDPKRSSTLDSDWQFLDWKFLPFFKV